MESVRGRHSEVNAQRPGQSAPTPTSSQPQLQQGQSGSGGRTLTLSLLPFLSCLSRILTSCYQSPPCNPVPRHHAGPAQDLGRHRWVQACLNVSLMLAFRSGTNCSILFMSSPAWRRAARTSSRSISCTVRLRAISYKCHCNVMDVWQRVSGCKRPEGPVTPEALRPMLNFHFQEPLPTLVLVSSAKATVQEAFLPPRWECLGQHMSQPSSLISPESTISPASRGHPYSQCLLLKDCRGLRRSKPTSVNCPLTE